MKRFRLLCLFFMSVVILSSCGAGDEKQEREQGQERELTARQTGAPYCDWGKSLTGSAKYLDGSTVLVSIFLEDTEAEWSGQDRILVMDNMDAANDFLVKEGKRYGKDVTLIYDIEEHPDLEYHVRYSKPFPGSTEIENGEDEIYDFIMFVSDYVNTKLPIQEIMERYQVNSIGFLVFIDGEADAATAYHYWVEYEGWYYEEIAFINLRWESTGENVDPGTYAHEILHLFGARDLYYTSADNGITREFVDYAAENYSGDIMLGNAADCVRQQSYVSTQITDITAYFIGWTGYIAELERFPSIKATYPAVFAKVHDEQGNYEEYRLKGRSVSERAQKNRTQITMIRILLLIFLVLIFIKDVILVQKHNNNEDSL